MPRRRTRPRRDAFESSAGTADRPCCWPPARSPPRCCDRILADGELRVVTRNSPDAYYLGSHGPGGPGLRPRQPVCREPGRAAAPVHRAHARSGHRRGRRGSRPHRRRGPLDRHRTAAAARSSARAISACASTSSIAVAPARPASVAEAARGQIEVAAGSAHQRTLEDLRLRIPTWPGSSATTPTPRKSWPTSRKAKCSTRSPPRPSSR